MLMTTCLALKECFRSLANVPGTARAGGGRTNSPANFRGSKLTRLLQDALAPTAASSRRNKASVSVMLVNVSPAGELHRGGETPIGEESTSEVSKTSDSTTCETTSNKVRGSQSSRILRTDSAVNDS